MKLDVVQMNQQPLSFPSRLLARLGNPLSWSITDRVLAASALTTILCSWYMFVEYGVLVPQPETANASSRIMMAAADQVRRWNAVLLADIFMFTIS